MEWKSRRRDVPERLEPSLSSGASAEEEGLDRFIILCKNNICYLCEDTVRKVKITLLRKQNLIGMPSNKNAVIRYMYLDEMLSDRHHYYTRTELFEKCNERLRRDGYPEVSKRTIELDLIDLEFSPFFMEIDQSIIVDGKHIIRYKDQTQSIFSKQISDDEKHLLSEALSTLGQFSGLNNFEWLEDLQDKLSDPNSFGGNSSVANETRKKVISFSCNPYLKNQNLLGGLFSAISNKVVVSVVYKKFDVDTPSTFIVYPYLLKQYNDRWYLICNSVGDEHFPYRADFVMNLPLDRIESYEPLYELPYKECPLDLNERFDDIVGVTYYENRQLERILFAISSQSANYIRTKPIHPSQTELPSEKQDEMHSLYPALNNHVFFTLECIPNYELQSLLYGYGKKLVVLTPEWLREEIRKEAQQQLENYSI